MFDWVTDVINYIQCLWDTFIVWSGDQAVFLVRSFLEALAGVIGFIPVPSQLSSGLSSLTASIDPSIIYFLVNTGVPQALGILGAGALFRLSRKLFTLGQW